MDERRSKIVRKRVFDCYLSPVRRQIAKENTVSSDFDARSSLVKSVFDCRQFLTCLMEGVHIWHTDYQWCVDYYEDFRNISYYAKQMQISALGPHRLAHSSSGCL